MKRINRIFLCAAAILLAHNARAADGPYLFDLLKKPAYRNAWNAMMAGQQQPQWLAAFARGGNGVTIPSEKLVIDGQAYEFTSVCKPHDCGDNNFPVLFTPGGGKAWGALKEAGKPPRYFGNPSPAQRAALLKALD